jgi:hypothetical protein
VSSPVQVRVEECLRGRARISRGSGAGKLTPSPVDLSGSPPCPMAAPPMRCGRRRRLSSCRFLCPLASVRGMADEPPPGARLKKSATIDFRNTAGEMKGKTWLGIYELDGDT